MGYARIKPRRGTLYEWSTVNPILDEGEMVVIYPDTGVGTGLCKFKFGDGVRKFTELPYAFDGASANSMNGGTIENFHLLQIRSGSEEEWLLINPIIAENELTFDITNLGFKVGNGVDKWEDLPYTQAGGDISGLSDYGDEDAVVVAAFTLKGGNNSQPITFSAPIETEQYTFTTPPGDIESEGISTFADIIPEVTEKHFEETVHEEIQKEIISENEFVSDSLIEEHLEEAKSEEEIIEFTNEYFPKETEEIQEDVSKSINKIPVEDTSINIIEDLGEEFDEEHSMKQNEVIEDNTNNIQQ